MTAPRLPSPGAGLRHRVRTADAAYRGCRMTWRRLAAGVSVWLPGSGFTLPARGPAGGSGSLPGVFAGFGRGRPALPGRGGRYAGRPVDPGEKQRFRQRKRHSVSSWQRRRPGEEADYRTVTNTNWRSAARPPVAGSQPRKNRGGSVMVAVSRRPI